MGETIMKKRILAMILVVVLVFSLAATSLAASFTDMSKDHWAAGSVDRWAEAGVLSGVSNNKFDPEGYVTRGQAAVIFAQLLKLEETADLSKFYDMDHWSAPFVAKVYAAGIMNGLTTYLMGPEDYMTREQFFTMLAVAMGIEGQTFCMKSFTDYGTISAYAVPYVNALVNLGFLSGRTATTLAPKDTMKRCEIASLLDRVITAYVTKDNETVTVEGNGIVLIVADNATVVGDNFTGTAVASGEADKVTVTGSFNGSINVSNAGASLNLSGLTGLVSVNANAAGVQVNNAPIGTTVTAKDEATNVTVNGGQVAEDTTTTVGGGTTTPVVPPVTTCFHGAYRYWPSRTPGCHDIICAFCGVTVGIEPCTDFTVTEPTCTEDGTRVCNVCGSNYVGGKAGHIDENNDNICDRDPEHKLCAEDSHIWDDGVVTKEPTCPEAGEMTYTCTACGETKTEEIPALGHPDKNEDGVCDVCVKFYLGVSSTNKDASVTTISATVYNDYGFVVGGFKDNAKVNAGNVSATVIMQNVASLNAPYKSHTISMNTGMNETETSLKTWLSSVYAFNGATVNINVNGKTTAYTLDAFNASKGEIVARTNEDATRAAWQELTKHIGTTTQAQDDSKIVVANGSFIHIGNKVLHFEKAGDLTIDNLSNMSGIQTAVRSALTLSDTNVKGVTFYAAAGTQLAVGQSVATLNAPAVITIDGITLNDSILTQMQDADTTYALMSSLMNLVNNIVGQVDAATVAPTVTIMFQETELPHICNVVTEKATCTTAGKTYCTNDGCTTEVEVVDALGHKFVGDVCINCNKDVEELLKAQLEVRSGAGVIATVLDDYSATLVIENGAVNASAVTLSVTMQDVDSLGVSNKRFHSQTITTGATGNPQLGSWLSNAFQPIDTDVVININGAYAFTYALEGKDGVITATPSNIEDARTAWHTLVNAETVATNTKDVSDSYILIDNGSYVILDTEKLMFETTAADLKLDGISGENTSLSQTIREHVMLVDSKQTAGVVLHVGAGTELAVSNSVATLLKDITIEIEGIKVADTLYGANVLAALRDAESTYNMLTILVKTINSMVGGLSSGTVTVNITIG